MRGYGETRGMIGDEEYTPQVSAKDVDNIMVRLSVNIVQEIRLTHYRRKN